MALVAIHKDSPTGEAAIIAVGRLIKLHGTDEAEFAILVSDRYQRQGLGTELLRRLLQVGRDEKPRSVRGDIHRQNTGMQHVCQQLGLRLHAESVIDPVLRADIEL